MVDLFLKLMDYVVKLGGIREGNRREYFDRYVQPAYETAELIYKDYSSLLADLREKISESETADPIIRLLEERRRDLLAGRTRLRAIIAQRVDEGRATRFEAGILGLMSGAMTSVGRPYFQMYAFSEAEGAIRPQIGRHTVLDILRKLKRRGSDDIGPLREELHLAVDEKVRGIEGAWQTVVVGYAELHRGTLPPAGVLHRPKPRRLRGIAEIHALLMEIYDMLDSGRFDRQTATDFENQVAAAVPQLSPAAQDVRETIHDLDRHEPNIAIADLADSVARFETELDGVLKELSRGL